ncbi:ABC transporter permease [Calidifontimicrobium sp. SYSU G02091]|uniref:ABC transporter permease n=1 Tax=Calidifontimicrobium sp. SYSU G02091 TaxID=2926421 RepID=UPI001F53CB66|nr:ABC transporter permease [Calidifontimicrobium sp. SYSU G02091]MCI1193432.1 ABC transporter permease [Calidifontimicrobium sp. SYSU G02091]
MLRLEARAEPSRAMAWLSPLVALALTAVIAAALFAWLGKDPVAGLRIYLVEPLNGPRAVSEVALKATPLVLCALGLAVCFRSNVWNIGAEGQFLLGAIAGGGVALWLHGQGVTGARGVYAPLVLAGGVLGGAAWAALTAVLRDRFNANEILVSLMLVYVAQQLLNYLVFGPWKDPKGFNFPQTPTFDASTWLPALVTGYRAHVGVVVALVLVLAFWVFMFRSWRGYQLQVGGLAPAAARYAGFSSRAALWTALLLSGAMAGLAGAMEVAGPLRQLTPHVSTGYGFTAIIVAFVGRLHPVGIVFSGVLLSMMLIGGELGQSRLGLPNALSGVFQGLLLFLLLACDTLIQYRVRWAGAVRRSA